MAEDIFDKYMAPQKMPPHIITNVARKLGIDETDVIIMAPERKKIRNLLKQELKEYGYI